MKLLKGLRGRLLLLGALPVFLFLLLSFLYIVPSMKKDIYFEKELQTKEFVNIVMSTVEMYYNLEKTGQMTREEAQQQVKEIVRNIRFGENSEDYYWINDTVPKMVMHPLRPDLDGEDLSGLRDPDGLQLFVEFANVAKKEGSGFVPYKWQYYSEKDRIEPKLSYVALFEPWDWVLGTGIYINDVDDVIFSKMITTLSYIIGIVIVTSIVILTVAHKLIIKPLDYAVKVGEKMADGDFTEEVEQRYLGKEDEISRLLTVFDHVNKNMESVIGDVLKNSDKIHSHSSELKASVEKTTISIENTVEASRSLLDTAASQKIGANESYNAIEEMAIGINGMADYAGSIHDFSDNLISKINTGNKIVSEAISKMMEIKDVTESTNNVIKQLNDDSKEIGSILALINGVAEQTNLLALNAAIEAARVGDQGKGFAVVADEIRKLANSTADSVGKVGAIIDGIAGKTETAVSRTARSVVSVEEGIGNVKKVEEMFQEIIYSQEQVASKISEMSSITQQMSAGTEELTATVSGFNTTSEHTADNAQHILHVSNDQLENMNKVLAFAQDLDRMSNSLKQLVAKFKI